MKKYFLIATLAIVATLTSNAQTKFGYLNSQALLAELPEIKAADTDLQTYQAQLYKQGQTMMTAFDAELNVYNQEMADGVLSKVQSTAKEADLTVKSQAIRDYETEMQQKLGAKRDELYTPILDKLTAVIKEYGEANGFTLIFDTSAGNILHAVDSDDLTEVIKTALEGA